VIRDVASLTDRCHDGHCVVPEPVAGGVNCEHNYTNTSYIDVVSVPDHFSPHGKNWSGERPIPFSFPAVAKIVT